jgi:hypothetical protein
LLLHACFQGWLQAPSSPENYHTESVVFNIAKVNLPFNAILSRPALYRFMAVAHYGYLVLKMLSPNDIIKISGDRSTGTFMLEKVQVLATAQEDDASHGEQDRASSSLRQCNSTSAPRM